MHVCITVAVRDKLSGEEVGNSAINRNWPNWVSGRVAFTGGRKTRFIKFTHRFTNIGGADNTTPDPRTHSLPRVLC